MLPSDPITAPDPGDAELAALLELGVYQSAAEAAEHGLVVLAMGRPYWLVADGTRHRLLVEAEAFTSAREQLARFDRESTRWPPAPLTGPVAPAKFDLGPSLLWAAIVLFVFWAQDRWAAVTALGVLDAQAVVERAEWWRVVTALFLHADADHILANLLSGVFIFSAVFSTIGRGRGLALLATASVATNALLALLSHSTAYRSLGASTAVFAALGLLTGRAIRFVARSSHPHRWRAMFVPLAAGLTVLALHGAGAQRADVSAHVVGFVAGLLLGITAAQQQLDSPHAKSVARSPTGHA